MGADLAPIATAGGKSMEVQVLRRETCLGEAVVLERVLLNFLHNALHHRGRHVVLRVIGGTIVQVDLHLAACAPSGTAAQDGLRRD